MEFILSGYGANPVKTLALYSLTDSGAKPLWTDSVENASFVCEGGGYLFTITEASDYAVVYLYQPQGKGYQLLDQKRIEGGALCHITYSSKNKALLGACYETGTLFSVRVESGKFGEVLFHKVQLGNNPADLTRTHCVVLNKEETQLIVINIALDRCYFYQIDRGYLTLLQILEVPKGVGPRHVLLSEDESLLYIITEYSNEILAYENKEEKRFLQRISTLSESYTGISNCSTLCFSKDRRFLYGANRGAESIALFEVRPDGTLSYKKEYDCGGKHPRHMLLTRDGRHLIVCNQNSDNAAVFLLNQADGALDAIIASIPFPAPSGVFEV